MLHPGLALLAALLVPSTAHATVYVWQDPAGALVLTNLESALGDAPGAPVVTYATGASPRPPADGGDAHGARADGGDGGAAPARSVASGRDEAPASGAAPAPVARQAAARSEVSLRGASDGPSRVLGAASGAAHAGAEPSGSAKAGAGASSLAPDGGASDAPEGSASPADRSVVDPRALLAAAAGAEPPRVVVRIVGSSAGPLSTSDRAGMRAGDRDRAPREDATAGALDGAGALGRSGDLGP